VAAKTAVDGMPAASIALPAASPSLQVVGRFEEEACVRLDAVVDERLPVGS